MLLLAELVELDMASGRKRGWLGVVFARSRVDPSLPLEYYLGRTASRASVRNAIMNGTPLGPWKSGVRPKGSK